MGIYKYKRLPKKSNRSALVLLIIIVYSCMALMVLRHFGVISTRRLELELLPVEWTFEEIVDYLDAPYPDGATNIEYDSHRFDRAFFIELRFDAPPESAMRFAESICDSELFVGYDPFNAIVGTERLENVNLVLLGGYYAYSPDTPESYLGNTCVFDVDDGGIPQYILVDATNPTKYSIRFEMRNVSGGSYGTLINNGQRPADFINPIPEFPFSIIGVVNMTDGYTLVTDKICFETRWEPYHYRKSGETVHDLEDGVYPDELIGASVQLKIDDALIFDTTVSDRWTLFHPDQDKVDYDLMLAYCHFEDWQHGFHRMELYLETADGDMDTFVWDVYAQ